MNGDYAEEEEFKYIVAFKKDSFRHPAHRAGTIIDKFWILTARHTIIELIIDYNTGSFRLHSIKKIYVHPKYTNSLEENTKMPPYLPEKTFCYHIPDDDPVFSTDSDLGLIKLERAIDLTSLSPHGFEKIGM